MAGAMLNRAFKSGIGFEGRRRRRSLSHQHGRNVVRERFDILARCTLERMAENGSRGLRQHAGFGVMRHCGHAAFSIELELDRYLVAAGGVVRSSAGSKPAMSLSISADVTPGMSPRIISAPSHVSGTALIPTLRDELKPFEKSGLSMKPTSRPRSDAFTASESLPVTTMTGSAWLEIAASTAWRSSGLPFSSTSSLFDPMREDIPAARMIAAILA